MVAPPPPPKAPAPTATALPKAPAPKAVAPPAVASTLPEDVRVKLVYLDGELHIKEGTRFIPLSKYTRGRP
jgi:hypothetical protein